MLPFSSFCATKVLKGNKAYSFYTLYKAKCIYNEHFDVF